MEKIPHQLTHNVKLLQKAVLIHQSQALILKRSLDSKSRPQKWDLAGGNSEWPDSTQSRFGLHQEDIAREIQEETGTSVDLKNFTLDNLVYFDTFFDTNKQIFSIICGWKYELPASFDRQQITISTEHSEMRWISLDEIGEIDFGGEHGEFVKKMIEKALL